MIRIKILSVGKTKESWLDEAVSEYLKRLQGTILFDFVWVKDDSQLLVNAEKEDHLIGLDPAGISMTSEQFSEFFAQQALISGARFAFVIGGPEGLPASLKKKIPLISLSAMTFTHQIARLILLEQVYRATEIQKGSKYHK